MREAATNRFAALRKDIFIKEAPSSLTDPFFVLPQVLPDKQVTPIINKLLQLDYEDLGALDNDDISKFYIFEIWVVTVELQQTFQRQLKQQADEKAASKRYAYSIGWHSTQVQR